MQLLIDSRFKKCHYAINELGIRLFDSFNFKKGGNAINTKIDYTSMTDEALQGEAVNLANEQVARLKDGLPSVIEIMPNGNARNEMVTFLDRLNNDPNYPDQLAHDVYQELLKIKASTIKW